MAYVKSVPGGYDVMMQSGDIWISAMPTVRSAQCEAVIADWVERGRPGPRPNNIFLPSGRVPTLVFARVLYL